MTHVVSTKHPIYDPHQCALASTSTIGRCCLANQASRGLYRLLSLIFHRIAQCTSPGTPPILIDDPPASRATHRLGVSEVLHVHCFSSCGKRMSYVPRLQLLLTVWTLDRPCGRRHASPRCSYSYSISIEWSILMDSAILILIQNDVFPGGIG